MHFSVGYYPNPFTEFRVFDGDRRQKTIRVAGY